MINIQVTRSPSDPEDQFRLNITGAESAEAAQDKDGYRGQAQLFG